MNAAAKTGRKSATYMVAFLLIAGLAMAVAQFALGAKADATVASVKVSYDGKDIVSVADAKTYSAKYLDVQLAAESTVSSVQAQALLDQRAAFTTADNMHRLADLAGTAYRAALVAGAALIAFVAFGIVRREGKASRVALAA